jgi:hypothetical protein
MARIGTILLFIAWAGLAGYGLCVYLAMEPTGDGFTRGLNRAGEFFKWEAYALALAIAAWLFARVSASAQGPLGRWLGRIPIIVSGGFFLVVAAAVIGAVILDKNAG